MITGTVTLEGVPLVYILVAGTTWPALIDTGFNGCLELPDRLRGLLNDRYRGQVRSLLASGRGVTEDCYAVDFPFDGQQVRVPATFAPVGEILVGTRLLCDHRLEIDFVNRTVTLERCIQD